MLGGCERKTWHGKVFKGLLVCVKEGHRRMWGVSRDGFADCMSDGEMTGVKDGAWLAGWV